MRYLTLSEVLNLYRRVIEQTGGTMGIRDLGALESALAQPRITLLITPRLSGHPEVDELVQQSHPDRRR